MNGRVLITGATGFVGTAVAHCCERLEWEVRTIGRAAKPPKGLPDYRRANILDEESMRPVLKGVDCVVHAAGLAHQFGPAAGNRDAFHAVNVDGTEIVVRCAARAGVAHVVLIGSVAVYGSRGESASIETDACQPRGAYAESKYLAEQKALAVASAAGMKITILRLATVYGAGDPGNIARLMRTIDRGRFVWLGLGANLKSLIHRDDVARACAAVLRLPPTADEDTVYNLTGPPCTVRDIAGGLAQALGKRLPKWHVPAAPILYSTGWATRILGERGRIGRFRGTLEKWLADDVYDGSKFDHRFGVQSHVGLLWGLHEEVAWFRGDQG